SERKPGWSRQWRTFCFRTRRAGSPREAVGRSALGGEFTTEATENTERTTEGVRRSAFGCKRVRRHCERPDLGTLSVSYSPGRAAIPSVSGTLLCSGLPRGAGDGNVRREVILRRS